MKVRKPSGRSDLFQLIHSLSKSEKRYFKLFTGNEKNKVYIRLFNAICKQDVYDENHLKKTLEGEAVFNNFHVAKKYLFELIMKSLILYNNDFKIDFKLKKLLQQIDICNKKGLYEISFKLLNQAEKIAIIYERPIFLLEVLNLKKINLMDLSFNKYTEEDLKKIEETELLSLRKIENIAYYKRIIVELFGEYVRWEGIRKPDKNPVFDKVKRDQRFTQESEAISIESKLLMYSIKGYYFHEIADYKTSLSYRKKIIKTIESKNEVQSVFGKNYLVAMYNYITDLRMLERYDEMDQNIEKYFQIPAPDTSSKAEQFRRYYILKTQYVLDTGKFDEIEHIFHNYKSQLPEYSKIITNSIRRLIDYHIARCFFGAGQYDVCIDLFMSITNNPKSEQETGIYGFSLLWLIFTHLELENYDILPYMAKSSESYFKKNKIYFENEKIIFTFFKNSNTFSKNKLLPALKKLKTDIKANLNPVEAKFHVYNEIVDWLESKIENIPLGDVITRRLNNR